MIRELFQDSLIALLRPVIKLEVLAQDAQIQQGADISRVALGGTLVQMQRFIIISPPVVLQGQPEQGARMPAIRFHRALEQGDHFLGIAADGGHRRATLIQVLRGLLDRTEHLIQNHERLLRIASAAIGLGNRQRASVGSIARRPSGFVAADRIAIPPLLCFGLAQVEVSHGTAIGSHQRLFGLIVSAKEIVTHPQPYGTRGRLLAARRQLVHRVAEDGVARRILGNGPHNALYLLRPKRAVGQDHFANIDRRHWHTCHHTGSPITTASKPTPAHGRMPQRPCGRSPNVLELIATAG